MTTNSISSSTEYWFDQKAVDRVVKFFGMLRHTKGRWAGSRFVLADWQLDDIISPLFGWKRRDGTRRYRSAYIEIPRKNGKSTLCAALGLYLTFGDNEPGAEVYAAAADKDQAKIVFNQSREMAEDSPRLQRVATVYKNSITFMRQRSRYIVLSAETYTQHGLNASGIIIDELHAQPTRELWDVLNTSTGARAQPLLIQITTAGFDRESICWEQREYARQILDGTVKDDSFFGYIAAADENDDWTSPAIWRKANPGLGITVSEEYLAKECERAKAIPAYQNTFRRLHLNQWTQQESRWLDIEKWNRCNAPIPDLTGRECYAGLDLASTTDIAALVLVFPPQDEGLYFVLPFFFLPGDNLRERELKDRSNYVAWVEQEYMIATPGEIINYEYIQATLTELGEKYLIREIAFDRWGAIETMQKLAALGFEVIEFGQGIKSMSPPTKELLSLVVSRQISHGDNPVLRWMADNVVVESDAAGNIKPNKKKSRQKIDGIVALIMALARAIAGQASPKRSIYEDRGLALL